MEILEGEKNTREPISLQPISWNMQAKIMLPHATYEKKNATYGKKTLLHHENVYATLR